MQPLEGRAVMSPKACACNLGASAPHSCEPPLCGGGAKGRFALPDVSNLSLGLRQKPEQDGLGMPAHVILQQIHVKCFWPQS